MTHIVPTNAVMGRPLTPIISHSPSPLLLIVLLSKGHMAFTSSTVVYGPSNGNTVDEQFRLDTRSERSTKMIAAEESILSRGGSVVRLAGLYTADRGPHTFWLKNGTVDSNADGLVNMLHYEDAASAAVAALLRGVESTVYLAADDEVVTREEICAAAVASGHFAGAKMPTFTSTNGPVGKICESKWTREALQWTPRPEYRTFANYMRTTLGGDTGTPPSHTLPHLLYTSCTPLVYHTPSYNLIPLFLHKIHYTKYTIHHVQHTKHLAFETEKQRKTRIRLEKAGGGDAAAAVAAGVSGDASSFLWIPGADEDLDSDIFKL